MSTLYKFRELQPHRLETDPDSFIIQAGDFESWYCKTSESVFYAGSKRVFDCVVSIAAMLILSPLMLLTSVLIKLESPGPVLFCQTRVGRDRIPFCLWKFRSMRTGAEALQSKLTEYSDSDDIRFKMADDPRITLVGKFIRKYSIDELPQLWNVLVGNLSLVGPRPPLPAEVAHYNLYHLRRLAVKPGITCTWQIGGRSEIPFEQQVSMDLAYIRDRSFLEDLRILFLTPYAVLSGRGAC